MLVATPNYETIETWHLRRLVVELREAGVADMLSLSKVVFSWSASDREPHEQESSARVHMSSFDQRDQMLRCASAFGSRWPRSFRRRPKVSQGLVRDM